MPKNFITPSYMNEFACLGGDCEDTCCQHWDISLDRLHYEKIISSARANKDVNTRVQKYIVLNSDDGADKKKYAQINMNSEGYCPFLQSDHLCQLHAEFGPEFLGNICAFYPRVLSSYEETVELTGAMSCPEVVRQCLLGKEGADGFTRLDTSKLPRSDDLLFTRRLPSAGLDYYADKFRTVREVMLHVLNLDDYAFETRLYFLSNLCHRLAPGYHEGCKGNDKLLREELRRIYDRKTLDSLDDYYLNYVTSEPVAIVVIQAILQLRLQQVTDDKFSRLIISIFTTLRTQLEQGDDLEVYGDNLPPDELWQLYQQHWDKLNARFGARLEVFLTRYLTNCLQREWFVTMPDPFIYIHLLTIRLALLRFLITCHPGMQDLLEMEDDQKRFDNQVVEVVYLFARSIDHNHAFLSVVYQAITEQQMMSFDYAMPFIKF